MIFNVTLGYAIREGQSQSGGNEIEWHTSACGLCWWC